MTCKDCKYSTMQEWTPIGYTECKKHKCLMPNGFMCGDLREKPNKKQQKKPKKQEKSNKAI